jgi:cyclopropane fatty-acyl-phospholipid synthase-like methyltransferase
MINMAREFAGPGSNCVYRLSDDHLSCLDGQLFDHIVSYIVFQHIPPDRALPLFDRLISHCAPGGSIAIQVTYECPPMGEFVEGGNPDMQMNSHDIGQYLRSVRERLHSQEVQLLPTEHGAGYHGYIIRATRSAE